ncbi:MAG: protein kinase domain-containing protein [Vicinamibacteria bacterium]
MSEAPQKISKYEIRGLVGKGSMGVVYNAVDPALGRAVAIKTLSLDALAGSPHEAELKLRFLREARSAGMLQHPNIITVHELFEEGGIAYLVMELLEGASLSSILRRKKELTLGERLSIIDQIAAGLSEAHAHRIIHRDLKPSNVFVLKNGVVKVLDFGVAKMGEGELTKAGTVFGTVEYMAPEQVKGATVNPRADIFSLGVVAYEVLSGRNPFRAETLAASIFKILSDVPERLSSDPSRVPADIDAIVFRALAKAEAERFESMSELKSALRSAAEAGGIALEPPALSEKDIVISRELADVAAASIEPQISQWSHVAAQADLLEEVYLRGVAAFNAGSFADCVEKMSQVLDEVPVHSLSLHYLAMSEENLRRERLSEKERKEVSGLLTAMREAHRRGESTLVIDRANALLAIDKESLEARWYRRNAEARLRAVSVGVSAGPRAAGPGRSVAGTLSREGGKSFGYAPSRSSRFHRGQKPEVEIASPGVSASESSGGKGIWILAGVGFLFVGLVVVWLSSFGGAQPTASANPTELPGVRPSPFDGIDADGTVVLQLPVPAESHFRLQRVIPTSIAAGRPTKVGIFGESFTSDLRVRCEGASSSIISSTVIDDGQIEIEIQAGEAGEILLEVENPQGRKQQLTLRVETE